MSFRRGRGGQGNGGSRFSGGGGGREGDNLGRGGGLGRREGGPGRLSNHTSDASMASARIFIGNLPTNDPRLTKEFLEERFSCYGLIMGMSILKGFGFIQFSEEASAEDAIRDAQHMDILGHRIDVKHVKSGKDGASSGGMPERPAENRETGGYRDRSPLRSREPGLPPRGREQDMPPNRGRDPSLGRSGARDYGARDRDWNRGREMDPYGAEPPMLDYDARDMHPRDPYAPSTLPSDPLPRGTFGGNVPPGQGAPLANEVEIIVTSKMGPVRQYAERIESRLKGQGMAVDVLFPHEEIPLRKVLSDLSARGTLFGIVVTPLNQEQGSITLNILFGQPEEHRNMPVEDAFCLLSTAFKRHKGVTGASGSERKIQIGTDAHPANIQHLINLLQENRPLTVIEYDRLIRYLSDQRERQGRLEMADDPASGRMGGANHHHPAMSSLMPGGGGGMNPLGSMGAMSTPGLGSGGGTGTGVAGVKGGDSQAELHQRIMNILNAGPAGGVAASQMGVAGVPAPVPVPAPHQTGTSVPSSLPWGGGGADVGATGPSSLDPSNSSAIHKPMDGHMQSGQSMMKPFSGPNMGSPNSRLMQQPNNYNPNPYMNKRF